MGRLPPFFAVLKRRSLFVLFGLSENIEVFVPYLVEIVRVASPFLSGCLRVVLQLYDILFEDEPDTEKRL